MTCEGLTNRDWVEIWSLNTSSKSWAESKVWRVPSLGRPIISLKPLTERDLGVPPTSKVITRSILL